MQWSDLVQGVQQRASGGEGNPLVVDICYDSRRVTPGAAFVAIAGFAADGMRFIDDALARGACAVVSEQPLTSLKLPWVQVPNARRALGELAARLWDSALQDITSVAVTGTNGKTSCATLIHALLAQRFGAASSWLFGTVVYVMGAVTQEASRTTPESADMFRLMAHAASGRPRALVMEVSSHALQLNRVAAMSYDVALFTNLTQDHLDFHKTMEAYYQAKKLLFCEYIKPSGHAVINIDDPWGLRLAQELNGLRAVLTYGEHPEALVRICGWKTSWSGSELSVVCAGSTLTVCSALCGQFNRANLCAAVAVGCALGLDGPTIEAGISAVGAIDGRLQRLPLTAPFTVVVDYAHTPDALEKLLATARELTEGQLICLFGCGGDRDTTKRALMAEAVARGADEAVVTSDNPRSEDPQTIIDAVLAGMPLDFPFRVEVDRERAIARALGSAKAGDCVVIAGKGHETYQEIAGVRHPFDDREVAARQWSMLANNKES
jgi:UDP-N-acetylmuramoyl-L-alanyl-D-glutamate--2,6-diaminopimelate ligase